MPRDCGTVWKPSSWSRMADSSAGRKPPTRRAAVHVDAHPARAGSYFQALETVRTVRLWHCVSPDRYSPWLSNCVQRASIHDPDSGALEQGGPKVPEALCANGASSSGVAGAGDADRDLGDASSWIGRPGRAGLGHTPPRVDAGPSRSAVWTTLRGAFRRAALARISHQPPAARADLAALAGMLGTRSLRRIAADTTRLLVPERAGLCPASVGARGA